MKLIIAALCLLPILIGCKPTHYTPKNYKGSQIVAGTSGGVTGMMKEHVLFENGQLFLSKGLNGEWRELRSLKKSKTKEIFKTATEMELSTLKFKHPGNMTYYLIMKHPPRSNEIKWGASDIQPPDGIISFYDYLMSLF